MIKMFLTTIMWVVTTTVATYIQNANQWDINNQLKGVDIAGIAAFALSLITILIYFKELEGLIDEE